MPMSTEIAIGGVVVRRLGAKWFTGVLLFTFAILYLLCDAEAAIDGAQTTAAANLSMAATTISIISLLLVMVIAATEIPYDISGRILLVILSKPIRRYQYIAGKLCGIIAAGAIYVIICYCFTGVLFAAKGLSVDAEIIRSAVIAILRIIAGAGIALFISVSSSEVPTIAGCIGGGICSFLLNMIAVMVLTSGLNVWLQVAIDPLLYIIPCLMSLAPPPTALGDMLTGVNRMLNSFQGADVSLGLDDLFELKVNNLGLAIIYSFIYLFIFLALSVWTFRKSEKVE